MGEQRTGGRRDGPFEAPRQAFLDALERRDPAAAAEAYAADGRLLLPSTTPLDGRPSIEAFWRAGLDAGMAGLELDPQSINPDAAFACEVGSYTLRSTPRDEAAVTEHGRYLIVHRLDGDGTWRRALEVWAPEPRPA
jgi:ketosteroid isomerase-like protein